MFDGDGFEISEGLVWWLFAILFYGWVLELVFVVGSGVEV